MAMTDREIFKSLRKIAAHCRKNLALCKTNKAYDFHTAEDAKAGWVTTIDTVDRMIDDMDTWYCANDPALRRLRERADKLIATWEEHIKQQ